MEKKEKPSFISPKEVCRQLRITRRTLSTWIAQGVIPAPIRFNRRVVRWKREDLDRRIEELKNGQ